MSLRNVDAYQRQAVLDAIAALELAEAPIAAGDFTALADPGLRALVEEALAAAGRVLLRSDTGWCSGYDDTIADRLAAEGIGVLRADDRAVLTLVLLRTVAAPRALGRVQGKGWCDAERTTIDDLALNRHLTKSSIRSSVRRLRLAGILRPGHNPPLVPGPQFQRLTPRRSQQLWEDLVLACQPDGGLAKVIRSRRREAGPSPVGTTTS